ncbi:MAG: efflux RND transporter permease subunit [Pseudomonadota bacterium]
MTLTRMSLGNPVAVAVGCILVVIFGVLSLLRLPIQMAPEVQRPIISINTAWRASAPQEVESEIVEPQEDVLRGLPGVRRMTATAGQGSGSIELEFDIDTDMSRALIEVMNRLNQVPRYPVDATEPVIRVGGGDFGNSIAWFAIRPTQDNPRPAVEYQDFVDEQVRTRLERVPGVSQSNIFGGRPYEVRITFDPYRAASLGIDLTGISGELGSNADVSAGFSEVGRRKYTLRFSGKYDVTDLSELVLEWRDNRPVKLKDIARVELALRDRTGMLSQNGGPSIAVNVVPESGVNVLEVMDGLKATMAELERDYLTPAGLTVRQQYDETVYINASIDMVRNNLLLGMALAIGVLWWFLRRFRATVMVALAIPLCLCVSFIVLDALGRTLNIISLAGLAFATGMVLDAAIVVLENIVRQREAGRDPKDASDVGTSQVWGALIASTVTTVAIFMPVVFLKDEAGQLFGDLAVTISVAVVASLVVAVTVLPTAAYVFLRSARDSDRHGHWWRAVADRIMVATATRERRLGWILGLTLIPFGLMWALLPPADYLPEGKRSFVFGFLVTPPGLGVDAAEAELTQVIDRRFQPYLDGDKEPQIRSYFLGFFGGGAFFGARPVEAVDVEAMLEVMNSEIIAGFPDTFGFANRRPVFGGRRGGRQIDVDLQGEDFGQLLAAGQAGFQAIQQAIPRADIRPLPGLELAEPELRIVPNDRRIAAVGWNRTRMATVVRALGDGAFVGEYFDGNRRLDVILRADAWTTPEELAAIPLATASGQIQTIGELAEIERTAGPNQIRRIDRRRTLTLQVTPPPDLPLEEAIRAIDELAAPAMRAALPANGSITYRGTAEALNEALTSMSGSFALAVVILYLLISALFRSFRDSLVVVMTIPMATVGGIIALRVMDLAVGQAMDLLTMIGFVILLGLVVNNAILLVYRARDGEREGLSRRDAVESAIRLRLRPILMSTMTSVFGMLPLMLMPGAGSELYRGLASVIVGGMLVSTLFTLLLLPSLLRMGENRHSAALAVDAPAGAT